MDKSRLETMRRVMSGYVERGEVPGIATFVGRRGEADVEAFGEVARDTIFRIASMTKPVTAVVALSLVEECVLRLDDPVDELLPELAGRRVLARLDGPVDDTVPANRPISLRDLLTFRSGYGMLFAPDSYPIMQAIAEHGFAPGPPQPGAEPSTPDEWISRLAKLPLVYQPGEQWLYHMGAEILGVLIARACGRSLGDVMRERVFEPLGMDDTAFSVPADKIDRLATSYGVDPSSGELVVFDEAKGGQWSRPPKFESGGGGLVSTIDDFAAFGRMMLGYGAYEGTRILSRPSVELMTTNFIGPEQRTWSILPDTRGWGLGLSVVTGPGDVAGSVGTFGWDGGLGTTWYSDPREGMVKILLTQRAFTSPIPPDVCRDFWTCASAVIDD